MGGVSEKYFRPVFRKVPQDQEGSEGQMCRFDCVVSGRPQPELFWYRDGVQVHEDRLHKIVVNENGINSLIIHATHRLDSGLYTCIARNRGGEDQYQVTLNVSRKSFYSNKVILNVSHKSFYSIKSYLMSHISPSTVSSHT